MVLILDTARFKYPPHWIPLSVLLEAMNTIDKDTGIKKNMYYTYFMLIISSTPYVV